MSDTRFESWSVAESPVTIDYSLVAIEEIRHLVAEGVQKLARGGVEVGGVLYGAREGRTIRIMAVRPIACEHARGPAFMLSDADRQTLEKQLEQDKVDLRLADMICLGWFLSHTRSEIALAESDLEIYERHFSAPWQVTLVVRPGRGGSMRAGFFVREHDGAVRRDSSYLEFNFPDRLAGVLDRPRRGDRPSAERRPAVLSRESAAAPLLRDPPVAAPTAGPQLLPAPPPRSKWPWLAAWGATVLAIGVLALRYFVLTPHVDPLALTVLERDGQLQIQWDHTSRIVTSAVQGSLSITDGGKPSTIPLTPQNLTQGSYTWKRASGDVEIRLSVQNAGGQQARETTTFLDDAPAPAGPVPVTSDSGKKTDAEQERGQLQTEIQRLRNENAGQAQRIQELERNLKILQARLGAQ
jgi:proteasome lid subunit RPN8/RPN11